MPHERNFYDDQFAERIKQIAKPGATPPAPSVPGSGGWNWKGVSGAGIAIVIAIRVMFGCMGAGSSSRYSQPTYYDYNPQPIVMPAEQQPIESEAEKLKRERLEELLRQLREQGEREANPAPDPLEERR